MFKYYNIVYSSDRVYNLYVQEGIDRTLSFQTFEKIKQFFSCFHTVMHASNKLFSVRETKIGFWKFVKRSKTLLWHT